MSLVTDQSTAQLDESRGEFFLFGHPISHSASPAFHNNLFDSLGLKNHLYANHETEHPETSDLLKLIRAPTFGGASVTMPIKVTISPYLDRLEPEAKEIGSVNTIIVKQLPCGKKELVGQNYDWIGIRNALLLSLPSTLPAQIETAAIQAPFAPNSCGFIIGGGGTTRAATYALSRLSVSPIYLINRDAQETAEIIAQFPQYDLRALLRVEDWTVEMEESVACGVGAIPCFEPITDEEKNVYKLAEKVFGSRNQDGRERLFLEMCYKPRITTIFNMATSQDWIAIQGIEAMIEQGLAQSRAWLLHSAASPFQDERKELGSVAEASARELVRTMEDITVPSKL